MNCNCMLYHCTMYNQRSKQSICYMKCTQNIPKKRNEIIDNTIYNLFCL